jgi:hypothetical protein
MNFFCTQSTDATFPLLFERVRFFAFLCPIPRPFCASNLVSCEAVTFPLAVTTGAAEAVSTSSDMRCLLHVSCFAR